mgnify:CR=1 FL=1
MANAKAQDMPPQGGYAKIPFKRVPARTLFNGYQLIAAYLGNILNFSLIHLLIAINCRRNCILRLYHSSYSSAIEARGD